MARLRVYSLEMHETTLSACLIESGVLDGRDLDRSAGWEEGGIAFASVAGKFSSWLRVRWLALKAEGIRFETSDGRSPKKWRFWLDRDGQ